MPANSVTSEPSAAAASEQADPNGEFLDHVQRRNQQQRQRQQPVAPLRAALRRGHDVAHVGVGQHDEEARPPRREQRRPARQRVVGPHDPQPSGAGPIRIASPKRANAPARASPMVPNLRPAPAPSVCPRHRRRRAAEAAPDGVDGDSTAAAQQPWAADITFIPAAAGRMARLAPTRRHTPARDHAATNLRLPATLQNQAHPTSPRAFPRANTNGSAAYFRRLGLGPGHYPSRARRSEARSSRPGQPTAPLLGASRGQVDRCMGNRLRAAHANFR